MASLEDIVASTFGAGSKCFGHCEQHSDLRVQNLGGRLVGCHVCPDSYVSRITHYSENPDTEWFRGFLSGVLGSRIDLREQDIRVASRRQAELGLNTGPENPIVMFEAYWTQNYRGAKRDDPGRPAVFMCTQCGSLFVRRLNSKNTLCSLCAG